MEHQCWNIRDILQQRKLLSHLVSIAGSQDAWPMECLLKSAGQEKVHLKMQRDWRNANTSSFNQLSTIHFTYFPLCCLSSWLLSPSSNKSKNYTKIGALPGLRHLKRGCINGAIMIALVLVYLIAPKAQKLITVASMCHILWIRCLFF